MDEGLPPHLQGSSCLLHASHRRRVRACVPRCLTNLCPGRGPKEARQSRGGVMCPVHCRLTAVRNDMNHGNSGTTKLIFTQR